MKIANKLKIALKSILSFQMGEVATDSAVLVFDGEELKEGMEVFVINEAGEAEPAADGEYKTEDGKVIVVKEGLVQEIIDPEAEVAAEPEAEVAQEAEEEAEPVEEPETEPDASMEDRIAALEERLAAFTDGLNQIVNSLAALEERIAEVEGKLAKVEAPAADPIDEEPEVQQNEHKSKLSWLRK